MMGEMDIVMAPKIIIVTTFFMAVMVLMKTVAVNVGDVMVYVMADQVRKVSALALMFIVINEMIIPNSHMCYGLFNGVKVNFDGNDGHYDVINSHYEDCDGQYDDSIGL